MMNYAAFLCASAIENGWLEELVSSETSSSDEDEYFSDSDDIKPFANYTTGEPLFKRFKYRAAQRDLDLQSKRDPSTFAMKSELAKTNSISIDSFDKLFRIILPGIAKKTTTMRMPIPPEHTFAAVLRYFMSGSNFKDIAVEANISRAALSQAIPNVCNAILQHLGPTYMKNPLSSEEWMEIAADYEAIWHFPLCLGAIDVRHIPVRCGKKEKNVYFNCYKYASIMIVALCDAQGCFRYVDVGCVGRFTDEEAFMQSGIRQLVLNTNNELPPDREIGDYNRLLPHVFVTDQALPLEKHLMTPFDVHSLPHYKTEAETFNMRLDLARKTIDFALGKLWTRFPILQTCILQAEKFSKIVKTCCVLHNYLLKENEDIEPVDFETLSLQSDTKKKCEQVSFTEIAVETRRQFSEYFFYEDPLTITEI